MSTRPMLAGTCGAVMAFVLAAMVPLHGQDQPTSVDAAGPIATDRPAVTNSSLVVPASSLQVENGFLETSSHGQSVVDGPESLVRIGITKRTELRFTVPDYFLNTGGRPGSGFGDFEFGVKEQLGPTPGKFDVSLILFLSFPTGASTVSSGGVRSGITGAVVARAVSQLDGCRNVLRGLVHSRCDAKCDRRIYISARSAIDETLGCVCRVRR
jgi:hypothetical protein